VYLMARLGAAQFSLDDELPDELFPTSFSSVFSTSAKTLVPVSKVMEKFFQFKERNEQMIAKRNESFLLRDQFEKKMDACFGASCREFLRSLYDAQVTMALSITKKIIVGVQDFQRECGLADSLQERKDCERLTNVMIQRERDLLDETVIVRSNDSIVRIAVGLVSFSLGLIYSIGVCIFTIVYWKFHMDWKLIVTCLGVAFICCARIAYSSVVSLENME